VTRRDIPNLISLARFALVVPVVALLVAERYTGALVLFALAGISDGLDGYLAKRYGWTSRVGAILDPLADKALLVSTYLALGWLGLLPLWLVAAVIVRDIVIIGGAAAYHYRIGRFDLTPLRISKLNTLLQIALALLVVFGQELVAIPPALLMLFVYVVLVSTLISGLAYVWVWGRRAWSHGRGMPT
jgi:cardiolipin synthase (CMP-forming)